MRKAGGNYIEGWEKHEKDASLSPWWWKDFEKKGLSIRRASEPTPKRKDKITRSVSAYNSKPSTPAKRAARHVPYRDKPR